MGGNFSIRAQSCFLLQFVYWRVYGHIYSISISRFHTYALYFLCIFQNNKYYLAQVPCKQIYPMYNNRFAYSCYPSYGFTNFKYFYIPLTDSLYYFVCTLFLSHRMESICNCVNFIFRFLLCSLYNCNHYCNYYCVVHSTH